MEKNGPTSSSDCFKYRKYDRAKYSTATPLQETGTFRNTRKMVIVDTGMPTFLTVEQWLQWIGQPENQIGRRAHDSEAQKNFLCDWYFNRLRLDRNFDLCDSAVKVLQEIKTYVPGLRLPRFLHRIYSDRPDIQRAFPPGKPNAAELITAWYLKHGRLEFRSAISDKLAGLAEDSAERGPSAEVPNGRVAVSSEKIGATLVGYAFGEFGLGEDIRTLAKCLDIAKMSYEVFNLPNGSNARQNDLALQAKITAQPEYSVTILCVSPFDIPRIKREYGERLFAGRHVIAYSPWELEDFPREWLPVWDLVDEIWAISRHVLESFKKATSKPCRLMSPAVDVQGGLRRHGIDPTSTYRFITSYDPNSFVSRKNPRAVLEAFERAFPNRTEKCTLQFLVNGSNANDNFTSGLRDASIDDPRLIVDVGTRNRADYLRTLASGDCFLSGHRAEGFGRNIAEAKALGLRVLSTAYSGSMDFLVNSEKVAWSYTPIRHNDYLYSEGLRWAEIDVGDLSAKMRTLFDDRMSQTPNTLPNVFNTEQAAMRYAARLLEIYERN